jgi:glycosyltransferase involved in cell wall biosynthesis
MIFLDADLSVHPSEISRLAAAMDDADIVIGSRRVLGATIPEPQPILRDLAGRLFNIAVRIMTGLPYRDTQCGFKAYHRRTTPVFQELETSGWAFDVELLVRSRPHGFIIKEVPVTWRHGRESRVRWSDAKNIFNALRRMRRISSPPSSAAEK